MEATEYSRVLDYLRKLCSTREYCTKDITDKALKRLEDNALAQQAVDTLTQEGFLCDLRYATAFVRDKSTLAGWGEVKIRHMLRAKGISDTTIREALGEIDRGKADDKLRKVLETKRKALKDDPRMKLKLLKFALSRGYTYDQVNSILPGILTDLSD